MAHGFLKGVASGSVVSIACVAVLSVFSEAPRTPSVTAAAPSGVTKPGVVLEPTNRSLGDRAPMIGRAVPRTPEPGADRMTSVPESARRPAAQPDVGVVSELPPAGPPEAVAETTGARPLDAVQSGASLTPGSNDASRATPAPRAPATPGALTGAPPPDPVPRMVQAPAPPAIRLSDPPRLDISGPAAPSRSGDPSEAEVFAGISRADRPGVDSFSAPAMTARPPAPDKGSAGDLPASAPGIVAEGVGQAPAAEIETDPVLKPMELSDTNVGAGKGPARLAIDLPRDKSLDPSAAARAPATPGSDRVVEVRVNRLPTLGDRESSGSDPETPRLDDMARTAGEPEILPVDEPPFSRFAVPSEAASGKPLVAVVLMDDGADLSSAGTGITAVRALPYPVSFAVDALLPDAAQRMRVLRDAGFEVLATVDLPEGAKAQDAEVSLSAAIEAVPEALAVLEGSRTGVQTSIDAASHAAAFLAASGHGLVAQNRGLNTVQMLAERAGVPAGVVFRDLDRAQQDPNAILRTLDQAAFRAGQENGVILLGRLRAETIAALELWALEGRADRVSIVPVSSVLKSED
jgi:polysaccharide deacetylase 2 family uncharacterized protein YibQ